MSNSDDNPVDDEGESPAVPFPKDEVTLRDSPQGRASDKPEAPRKSPRTRKRARKSGRRGRSDPAFLASFPKDPELSEIVAAFERGDYAAVRERANQLAKHAENKRVRRAARELLHRIEPDPLAKLLLVAAFALLLFLVIWAYAAH